MTNIRNNGTAIGRLVRDPQIFTNSDGSQKALITVAVQRNYRNGEGKRDSDFVPLEGFIPAANVKNSVYNLMHKGDMVGVEYTIRSSVYTDKAGKTQFGTALSIQSVDLMEGKTVTDKRLADRAAEDAAKAGAYTTGEGAPVSTPADGATVTPAAAGTTGVADADPF